MKTKKTPASALDRLRADLARECAGLADIRLARANWAEARHFLRERGFDDFVDDEHPERFLCYALLGISVSAPAAAFYMRVAERALDDAVRQLDFMVELAEHAQRTKAAN